MAAGYLGPAHSLESSCRWDSKWKIGDKGAEYEFDIKMPPLGIEISDDQFTDEADMALEELAIALRARYSWIGRVGRAGRSGGWLAIEDKKGLATFAKLENITEMVAKAKRRFAIDLLNGYPDNGRYLSEVTRSRRR